MAHQFSLQDVQTICNRLNGCYHESAILQGGSRLFAFASLWETAVDKMGLSPELTQRLKTRRFMGRAFGSLLELERKGHHLYQWKVLAKVLKARGCLQLKSPKPPKPERPAKSQTGPKVMYTQDLLERIGFLHSQGMSGDEIAKVLTEAKVPTCFGRPWHRGVIYYLLKKYNLSKDTD